jgi:uncharacterized protein with LGFP repeats
MMPPAVSDYYDAQGGPSGSLGYPLSRTTSFTNAANGDGYAQTFETGMVHSSAAGTFTVSGGILTAYSKNGWFRGFLGWPTGAQVCGAAGCTQPFMGGSISQPTTGDAIISEGVSNPDIKALYDSLGAENGALGYPVGGTTRVTDKNGNGYAHRFQNNAIIHSSAHGTWVVAGKILDAYTAAGWLRGSLGWPTGPESCDATGCSQDFAGGTIRIPVSGAAFVVGPLSNPDIKALYESLGGGTGSLGYPVGGPTAFTHANGNGVAQRFEKDAVVHSSARGTFVVSGDVLAEYVAQGWFRGPLGWPTGAATCDADGCVQQFAGGVIDTH